MYNQLLMLEQCSKIIKDFEANYIHTGQKYNIFKAAGICENERIICRIIADLLNPEGDHYKGCAFLNLFIEVINEKLIEPLAVNTENTRVYTEYGTDLNRRIDIVIEDENVFIPIEVKVNARDQENQISHYAGFSRKKNKKNYIPVFYLTIDRNDPENAKKDEYIPISFKNEILKWLNKCVKINDVEYAKPVFEILKQFTGSIKSLYGISGDEKMEKAIEQIIFQSEDSVNAAINIRNSLDLLDDQVSEIFKDKILQQLKKHIPNAKWMLDSNGSKWNYIDMPFKNGKYLFAVSCNWQITVWSENKISKAFDKSVYEKMTALTNAVDEKWDDNYVWASSKVPYLGNPGLNEYLFMYRLYKQYSEHTSEVVDSIIKIYNELNNI